MKLAILVTACLLLQSCGVSTKSQNYEFHIVVDTPQGPAEGRGVVKVVYSYKHNNLQGGRMAHVNGEAIAVDLPDKHTLFMLMDTIGQSWSVCAPWVRTIDQTSIERGKEVSADPLCLPEFAYFEDNSPSSIIRVDPFRLSKSFGKGYSIRRVSIKETSSNVTHTIIKRLPWLKDYNAAMSGNTDPIAKDQTYPESIYYWYLIRGLNHG